MTSHRHSWPPSPEYIAWGAMIQRCTNPKCIGYKDYGGRGIAICKRWRRFEAFFADMGKRPSKTHSLDRIDVNGNYEPANCRWATKAQQTEARRDRRYVTFQGQRRLLADWAKALGCEPRHLFWRLSSGWSIERALTTPVIIRKKFS